MAKRLLALEQDREFARRYEKGESACSIARRLGLAKDHAVRSAIRRAGVEIHPSTHRWVSEADTARVAEQYMAGAPLSALARKIGTSPSTIRSRHERRGVAIRAPRKLKAEHHN